VLGACVVALVAAACITPGTKQGLETVGGAQDVEVQAKLRQAAAAAHVYEAENGTLSGFNASAAAQIEPSVTWTDGPASAGQVSIRGATEADVALVSMSSSGQVYCIGVKAPVDSLGKVDAVSAAQCTGGW